MYSITFSVLPNKDSVRLYERSGRRWYLDIDFSPQMLLAIPSPGTKSLASTNIASLELGTGALRKDLTPTNTLGACSHRHPRDSESCCTLANLLSIRRSNRLASCGAYAGGR